MTKPLRVLVLEDRAQDAELFLRELRRAGFDPEWKKVETKLDFPSSVSARLRAAWRRSKFTSRASRRPSSVLSCAPSAWRKKAADDRLNRSETTRLNPDGDGTD